MKPADQVKAELFELERRGIDRLSAAEAADAFGVSAEHFNRLINQVKIEAWYYRAERKCWMIPLHALRGYLDEDYAAFCQSVADHQVKRTQASENRKARALEFELGLEVLARIREPGERLSVAQIADVCGCSQSRINQIEAKALRKLRRAVKVRGITLESLLPR